MGLPKKAFYPTEETEEFLKSVPKGQFSSRINDLILKGLTLERQTKIEQDYKEFSEKISKDAPRKKNTQGLSSTMMMSAKAFEAEDEIEDFY